MTTVDALMKRAVVPLQETWPRGTPRAEGEGQTRVLVADHGSNIIGSIVRGGANNLTSRTVDHCTGGVGGVALPGWDNLHPIGREGIAIDVGEIVGDFAVGPGELELRHRSAHGGVGRQLDGDADAGLRV